MKNLIVGICDDNKIYLDKLYHMVQDIISDIHDIEIQTILPETLISDIQNEDFFYDILITDIDLGGYNGIELAKEINTFRPSSIIIFISNFLNYATDVYDVNHIYFVLKAEADTRLPRAIDKALSVYHKQQNAFLNISYQNKDYRLALSEIFYIEAMGRYLYIHTEKETYKCIKTLKDISGDLSRNFSKCHKSFIINLDYIFQITRSFCVLKTKAEIPISATHYKPFMSDYRHYASDSLE